MFFDTFGGEPDGLTIRITKRIPSGAGLGGGSADAAAVLRALNRWKDYPLSVYALCELGAQIGSDVPFCVLCGTALAEGRGERLTKLPDTPEMFTVICKPDVCFSTPALYAKLDDVALAKRRTRAPCEPRLKRAISRPSARACAMCLSRSPSQTIWS